LIVLRVREPGLIRPFRISGGTRGAVTVAIGPCALLVLAFAVNRHERVGSMSAAMLAVIVILCGLAIYPAAKKFCS
jgi:hypothetical protein